MPRKVGKEGRSVNRSFSHPEGVSSIMDEMEVICKREGWTFSEGLVEIIKDYVSKHKEGNSQHLITSFQENDDFAGFPSMGIDFEKKKEYIEKNLIKDGRLTNLGKELWGHICQWQAELKKG